MQPIAHRSGSLWFTPAEVTAARQRAKQGDPLARAILLRARAAATTAASPLFVGGLAALALIEEDTSSAITLVDQLVATGEPVQDLGLAHRALQLAVAYTCAGPLIDDTRLATLRTAAAAIVLRLRTGTSSQNPHAVQNNWWAITHAGALLAALVADQNDDHAEEIRWALGRCQAFCQHFGPAGLYHEGLGYELYTLSHLLPALAAAEHRGLIDLREECPWLTRLAESLFASTGLHHAAADSREDAKSSGAMMLSWNDAGLQWPSGIVSPLMLRYADPIRRDALLTWSQRLEGMTAEHTSLYGDWEGWPFALVLLTAPAIPGLQTLRTHISDARQGLAIIRDRWHDGDDAVLGCYARNTHIGGHSHDDGGSIRLHALGQQWILGGGQARGQAAWQSVVTPDEIANAGPRKAGCGAVLWDEGCPNGGIFAMDLRRVSGAYHERYCALAGNNCHGVEAAAAVLDLIDDHLARSWTWRITYAPELTYVCDADGAGFVLRAADGCRLHARFLSTRPTQLRNEICPGSQRTFSDGRTVHYPERPVIAATFAGRPHLAIYAAITITRGTDPVLAMGPGVDLTIGDSIWERPFSAAIVADYDVTQAGTLSRFPTGRILHQ